MLKLGDKFRDQLLAFKPRQRTSTPVVIPAIDEAQIVGEVLEWLANRGAIRPEREQLDALQRAFFMDRRQDEIERTS